MGMIESNDGDPMIEKFERFLDKLLPIGWIVVAVAAAIFFAYGLTQLF